MKFCSNCGTQLDDAVKFCTECGQRMEPAVPPAAPVVEPEVSAPVMEPIVQQEPVAHTPVEEIAEPQATTAAADVHVYGQPVTHSFSEPVVTEMEQGVVHTYGAPVSHSFTPPVQTESALSGTYDTAAPQPEIIPAAKSEPVAVAAASASGDSGTYSIPEAAPEKASKTPKVKLPEIKLPEMKMPAVKLPTDKLPKVNLPKVNIPKQINIGGKKIHTALIAVLVLAIVVGLFSCVGGGGDKADPILGLYNAVSCSYGGFELDVDGEWIELESGGKLKMNLMGDEFSCKWELDGENLTVTQAGDTYYGTLEDGVIVLDLAGLTYIYEKEATVQDNEDPVAATDENDSKADNEAAGPESGKKVYYIAVSGNANGAEMNESTLSQMGGVSLVLNGDGTGTFDMFGQADEITYDGSTITRYNTPMEYTIDGDYLYLKVTDAIEFTMMTKMDAMNRPKEELTLDDIGYWEGDYYGWWVIENIIEGNSSAQGNWWDCCMSLDINTDGSGTIVIWDEDYGKDDPIAEVAVTVTNYAGVTRIISESGQFMGDPVEHADWLFYSDATNYKDSLGFTATYEDDEIKMDCYFFLRQWGTIWDDVEEKDLPGFYDSWYLPLLNSGVTAAPETIG